MRADVDPMGFGIYKSASVLGLAVEQSIHGEKTNTAFLVQGGLGLADREDYLSADSGKDSLRGRYREYVAKMLALAGFHHADERASAVLALEAAMALSQGTRAASSDDHNADNVWARSDFAQKAPGMDWTVLDAADCRTGARSLATDRRDRLAALVASQPLEVWKDYLRFHTIHDYADAAARTRARPVRDGRWCTTNVPIARRHAPAMSDASAGCTPSATPRAEGAPGANLR
jgi:putative endopeptidase